MASHQEHNDSTGSIVDEPISHVNTEDGTRTSAPFMDVNENIQDSSESNDSDSEELLSVSDSCININGTLFGFLHEFRMVFDKLFFCAGYVAVSPFGADKILQKHLRFRNPFVEHKRSRENMEPIASTHRIVAHILSMMPVHVKQIFTRKILTKILTQRPTTGPFQCSARRPRSDSSECDVSDFFSYFVDTEDSSASSSIYPEDELTEVKCLKSMIENLTYRVLTEFEIIKDLADLTLRQYESGDGLDLVKTIVYLEEYEATRKDDGIKEVIFEELALIVANDCEKHLQSTFKILVLRNLLNLYENCRSRISYAMFLLKIHQKIDTDVKDISMNIRSLVPVARNLLWTKEK